MKIITLKLCGLILIFLLSSCSSSNMKLTKLEVNSSSRIVFGKIIDMNPDSKESELQITYVLKNSNQIMSLSFGNKFPHLEPKSDFFWISIPKETEFFGVTSIRFAIQGVEGVAIIRDDKTHKPLLGTALKPGTEPVYIGEIVIRSGTRKYGASKLPAEGFDLKELNINSNVRAAKEILDRNGIDSSNVIISTSRIL